MDCLSISGILNTAGIGVRIAIYIQNILSFGSAFYSLINDGKVDLKLLRTVEKQATTILTTAFAILISLGVQALSSNMSAFHTSIVLSLSWMNTTNTFIYSLLYVHYKSYPERGGQRIKPFWWDWCDHVVQAFRLHTKTSDADYETNDVKGL
jgi:hypothetical protein